MAKNPHIESLPNTPEGLHKQTIAHIRRIVARHNDEMYHEEEQLEDGPRLVGDRTVLQGGEYRHLSVSRYHESERQFMTDYAHRRFGVEAGLLEGQIDLLVGRPEGPRFLAVIRVGEEGAHAVANMYPDVENPFSAQARQCEDVARSIGMEDVWQTAARAYSEFNEDVAFYSLPLTDQRLQDLNAMLNLC